MACLRRTLFNRGAGIDHSRARCVKQVTGILPDASTGGGTSDGRFIAPTGAQVVEIGPCNATIHKLNERMRIADIEKLSAIYELILQRLL